MYDVPDKGLDPPPEPKRKVVYICFACGRPIKDGDEYYQLKSGQHVCANCVQFRTAYAEDW
jgi:DNA-directed RNA polymerase subunit RPC12/RpoP